MACLKFLLYGLMFSEQKVIVSSILHQVFSSICLSVGQNGILSSISCALVLVKMGISCPAILCPCVGQNGNLLSSNSCALVLVKMGISCPAILVPLCWSKWESPVHQFLCPCTASSALETIQVHFSKSSPW